MEAIVLAIVLLGVLAIAFDLHVTMHGLLAAIGSLSLSFGLGWLIWVSLSPLGAIMVSVPLAFVILGLGRPLFRSLRMLEQRPPAPEFSSDIARAVEPLQPVGFVRIDGTLWRGITDAGPVEPGQKVLILERRGLSLRVVPLSPEVAQALEIA